jgi:GT2 family glycosyltransferase
MGHSAAFARNRGAEEARGTYLLFQDADCFADSTLLNNAAKYLEDFPVDGVATRTTNVEPKNWVQKAVAVQREIRWENNQSRPILLDKTSGINVAIMKREAFEALGGFNESIFYFEDNDLTKRFFESGRSAIFGPEVIQYHNDPLSLRESIGQCKSIAKGMKKRGNLTRDELITLSSVPINILTGYPQLFVWAYFWWKSKRCLWSFYFSILWSIRSAAKLYYYLRG